MKPIRCGKWLHCQEQRAEESSTCIKPLKSWWNPVTIEEVEDDEIYKMNAMNKLDADSIHIMESDNDDKQILFECQNKKETWQCQDIPQEKPKDKLPKVPSYYRKRFEHKNAPKMTERSVPTLHSDNYKYKGPSPKEEVLLATMDANINELKKGDKDLPELHKKWVEAAADIPTGAPSHLPPLQEVNHKIPIIDENKRYNYHLSWCPESLKTQLINKIQTHKNAGWWEETNFSQAAPTLCIFKKDGVKFRTVIDGCKHNDNTMKDVTWPHSPTKSKYVTTYLDRNINQKLICRTCMNKYVWNTEVCGKQCLPPFMAHSWAILCSKETVMPLLHSNGSWPLFSKIISKDLYTYILTIYLYTVTRSKSTRNISSSCLMSCAKHIFI